MAQPSVFPFKIGDSVVAGMNQVRCVGVIIHMPTMQDNFWIIDTRQKGLVVAFNVNYMRRAQKLDYPFGMKNYDSVN